MQENTRIIVTKAVKRERFLRLINRAMDKLDCLGISYGVVVLWEVNARAKRRWGQCEYIRNQKYKIDISERLFQAEDHFVEEVILHELLHTCKECKAHGAMWKKYASRVNEAYGFHIAVYGRESDYGIEQSEDERIQAYRFAWKCRKCHNIIGYYKKTKVVRLLLGEEKIAGTLRCQCGGDVFVRLK